MGATMMNDYDPFQPRDEAARREVRWALAGAAIALVSLFCILALLARSAS